MYRFAHEKRPNRRASSYVKLRLMFISKRVMRDGMPFPREKQLFGLSFPRARVRISCIVAYTHAKVWNDSKRLLAIALGLMLYKSCRKMLINTAIVIHDGECRYSI